MYLNYSLFLDDVRYPFDNLNQKNWIVARTADHFKQTIANFGFPSLLSLDHDLGDAKFTGLDAIKFLCSLDMESKSNGKFNFSDNFDITTHGNNSIANEQIINYYKDYIQFKKKQKQDMSDFISNAFL